MWRKFTLFLFCLTVLGSSALLSLRVVSGHAEYDHSDPAADAVLAAAPTQVQIWFSQELFRRQGTNKLEVYDAAEQRVDLDDVTIDDDDRTLLRVSLSPSLPAGRYTVRWQALSAEDGHEGQGEFAFTVGEAAAGASPASSTTVTTTITDTVDTAAQSTATPTSAPEPATTVAPTPTPGIASTPTPRGGLPCLGGAAPLLLVVGALFLPRRRWFGK